MHIRHNYGWRLGEILGKENIYCSGEKGEEIKDILCCRRSIFTISVVNAQEELPKSLINNFDRQILEKYGLIPPFIEFGGWKNENR